MSDSESAVQSSQLPQWSEADNLAMSRALELAQRGLFTTDPNPRVGCVLVREGQIVGEGWHREAGGPHAEAHALAQAGERARGATAYVTLEPCDHQGRTPPCSVALLNAGVAEVVCAVEDPDLRVHGGNARLAAQGVRVRTGLMREQAEALNVGFFKRFRQGLPFVRVKLAMSLDGHTALANGESRWITSSAARKDAQRFRARSSAILTGIGTVLADDPAMNVRLQESDRQPLRVILDSDLRTPPNSRIVDRDGKVLIIGTRDDAARRAALLERCNADVSVEVLILPAVEEGPALREVLALLAARGVNELWVEAGAKLAGAFVAQGLVDELIVYVAPSLLGSGARGLLDLPALQSLDQRIRLRFTDMQRIGDDLRLTLTSAPQES
ncbi:MAG: bifunctional diaminohydroxyphosphoribosylaminopyrimidine deaminase/5-amino-6-(5-phosphoribosylamino)uracil reductase RibD [Nevskiaceae bacterium]|nr:bifunctional diaminohydroxyphosphoribosylaminopyrimidine deaminase/5-amino-6-(5-phosphoribosylamino)uracil reductase RibD [Nevskiaceae bacterium]